jgi:signal transduction histidine kinase
MRRYIANAAHELRTPVAILRARVENAADSPFKAELRRDVKKIQAIIDQLLISARLAENQAAVAQEVDLVRAARAATADYSPLVFVSGRRIAFEAETARLPIRANAQAVGCVIANLIDNALRAEPEGGTVLVRVRRDAVVEVVDHGAGVALQDRELIFEPFWRKSEDGSGLGLAISKELIEKLGGAIRVRETPQGGATFELQFQKSESGGGEGVRA